VSNFLAPKEPKLLGELTLHDADPDNPKEDGHVWVYKLLDYLEQHYYMHGSLPSFEQCQTIGLKLDLYKKWITSRKFRQKLADRGVPVPGVNNNVAMGALTEQQKAIADIMTDLMDTRSQKKKLEQNGITTQTYQSWLHDPAFVAYLHAKTEREFLANQHEAHLALIDAVKSGDLNAIKYYNEMTGRFTSAKDRANTISIGSVIQQVIEVLQEETRDPELLQRVGVRLSGLIADATAQENFNKPAASGVTAPVNSGGEFYGI
jgi:hypothetical protein